MNEKQKYLTTSLSFDIAEYSLFKSTIDALKDELWTVVSDDFNPERTVRTLIFKRYL